ncbi:MAG: tripartite tricarboxylate transporter substrate binding protein, partial [Alphaproteobacteria bacterium]|nr:tripartite tricarboxylate transporter substrate binding protein [Alphaproteobacteria bacterium]
MFKNFAAAGLVAVTALGATGGASIAQEFKPRSPECLAPSAPGGGWDFICRTTAQYLREMGLIDGTMQVTNMTGAGGGVAYA